jgi:hypothetical protein
MCFLQRCVLSVNADLFNRRRSLTAHVKYRATELKVCGEVVPCIDEHVTPLTKNKGAALKQKQYALHSAPYYATTCRTNDAPFLFTWLLFQSGMVPRHTFHSAPYYEPPNKPHQLAVPRCHDIRLFPTYLLLHLSLLLYSGMRRIWYERILRCRAVGNDILYSSISASLAVCINSKCISHTQPQGRGVGSSDGCSRTVSLV